MPIICVVPQKIERREGHKDQRQEAKMASKNEKDSKAKNDEIFLLIDMLEVKPCLWKVYRTDYTNHGTKEIAYPVIATSLDANIPSIKTKINGLRAQLGQERAKEKSTKTGQGTDKLYSSNWIHYGKLAFLVPVIEASKSRDTLKRINLQEDEK